MSLVRIVQTLGLLECCEKRRGKSTDAQKRCLPETVVSPECFSGLKQQRAGGVGINFLSDKTGALVVRSLIPQGNIDELILWILGVYHRLLDPSLNRYAAPWQYVS